MQAQTSPTVVTSTVRRLLSALDSRRAGELARELLVTAGNTSGGDAPWAIAVHDDRLWTRVLREGSIGLGESWKFYLLASAAFARTRFLQLYQVGFTRQGTPQPPGVRGS
jgi:hypothetical protein